MGGEVVSTYLCEKLSSILREAVEDAGSQWQIMSPFITIERRIRHMCLNSRSSANSPVIPVDLLYKLIDALSECRILADKQRKAAASKKGFFRVITNPLTDSLFKRNMRNRLDEIERMLETTPSAAQPPELKIPETHPTYDHSQIIGLESHVEKIVVLLMPNNSAASSSAKEAAVAEGYYFTAIGIVGRYGCGKTTLARMVFGDPRIQNEFSPRIWVCLSRINLLDDKGEDPRLAVLNRILEKISDHKVESGSDDESRVVNLLEKLQRELKDKRYLIVLDDAWCVDEWYADLRYRLPQPYECIDLFSSGLPKGKGGTIIVTSRQENVIRMMVGDKHVIRMEPRLSNEVCWQIFSSVVQEKWKMDADHHPKLSIVKDEVIRNCDGLPLAANALANLIPSQINAQTE